MQNLVKRAVFAPLLLVLGAQAQAANWEIDSAESSVVFKYSYEGTPYEGEFKNVAATFDIDPMNPASCNFSVTIPIADISVGDAETLDYLMDLEMFDVDQFPTASFQAEKCSMSSMNNFTSEGMLTIRDQTHPMTFPFTMEVEMYDGQPRFHLTTEVTVQRLDYGVGQGYWANTATIPNEVIISIDLYANQK